LNATDIYTSLQKNFNNDSTDAFDQAQWDMNERDKKDFDDAMDKMTEWLETTDRYKAKQ
jgi:hypothetical protein